MILLLLVGVTGRKVSIYSPFNQTIITDSELYQKCKKYGNHIRHNLHKFEGLLPEVYRRRLYRRRGFASIYEFAAKLACMSHAKVDRILQLSKKLKDKPKLKEVFESGKASYSKVAKVAYIANPETDEQWAEKVQNESCMKLDLAVKREKSEKTVYVDTFQSELMAGILAEDEAGSSVGIPAWTNLNFHVAPGVERKFRALKQKLEKESGETISYGEVLAKLMEMAEKGQGIPAKKQTVIKICPDCTKKKAEKAKSRPAPISVRRLVLAQQNNQCARAHCTHPPSQLHHINGYALTKSHSPEGLEYLCENHHKLAHAQHEFVQVYRRE